MGRVSGRLFCFGMPKCGTTSVAALLNKHPAICLHNQKEPGDFLRDSARVRLSGYEVTDATRWLADFTTTYGLRDNRDRFFNALRRADIAPDQARFVLCLRNPPDLVRSYLRHIAERRSQSVAAQIDAVRAEILSACDFEGAVTRLEREAGRSAVFVVRFDDLMSEATQHNLAVGLYDWLGLPPQNDISPIWANVGGSAGRYPAALERIAGVLRQTDVVRKLSPQSRTRIRQVFSRAPTECPVSPSLMDETVAWLEAQEVVQRSRALFEQVATGPLAIGRGAA